MANARPRMPAGVFVVVAALRSSAICHMAFAICHLSFPICHLSFAICHLPFAICPLPSVIGLSGGSREY